MKFSILMPAFKAKYLHEAIMSVLQQDYADFELVIVNDASPYDIDSIVMSFADSRIKYHKNTVNTGPINIVDNWNRCLELSSGDYIMMIGDDDRIEKDCLSRYKAIIEKYPDLDVYHGMTLIINENGDPLTLQDKRAETETAMDAIAERMLHRQQFIGDYLFKAEPLKHSGGFVKLPLAWGSDDITVFRSIGTKGIANINVPVFNYRSNPYSITSSGNVDLKFEAMDVHKKWLHDFVAGYNTTIKTDIILKRQILQRLDNYFMKKASNLIASDIAANGAVSFFKWLPKARIYGLPIKLILYSTIEACKIKNQHHANRKATRELKNNLNTLSLKKMEMKTDVVIPILKRDLQSFLRAYPYILENLPARNIILIGGSNVENAAKRLDRVKFIHEDSIEPGLTLDAVRRLKKELSGSTRHAGWYFQQFLKMAYARLSDCDYYLVWDADTIPINKIDFFDRSGRPYLAYRDFVPEDKCYNPTQESLLPGKALKKQVRKSFIAEHMLVKTGIMKELLDRLEANHDVPGRAFFEKIMHCVPQRYINLSGFSEFELYAAFVLKYHPDTYVQRKWNNLRNAKTYVGPSPDGNDLRWISTAFDTVSLEDFDRYWFVCRIIKLADKERKKVPFSKVYSLLSPVEHLYMRACNIARDIVKR